MKCISSHLVDAGTEDSGEKWIARFETDNGIREKRFYVTSLAKKVGTLDGCRRYALAKAARELEREIALEKA